LNGLNKNFKSWLEIKLAATGCGKAKINHAIACKKPGDN
jgi:hypothetical protein